MRSWAASLCGLAALLLAPDIARAQVERYALIAGNDRGEPGEPVLRYAQVDAERMHDVLRELGGFEPGNVVLLKGEDAESLRRSLIALNARIRDRIATPGVQVMLVVYYSGHADAADLHMAGSRLALRELEQLVRGSPATFRIAILDGCRSGAITRAKGGKRVAPFALTEQQVLPGEGLALLTASAEDEDAQEADDLGGSFFTHALISGLLGAADEDGDGNVVLDEAYRYAYGMTVQATSRTFGGTQHPSYRYELAGRGDFVITSPGLRDARRAHVQLPAGTHALLFREGEGGLVVAEVSEHAASSTLSVRPGRYLVRARGRDALYEGTIDVTAGTSSAIRLEQLEPIEYAQLVRKGGGQRRYAHAFELGAQALTPLANSETPCFGAFAGYAFDTADLGARVRLGVCTASSDNEALTTTLTGYGLAARVYRAWDIGPLTLELGLGPGLTYFAQSFETRGTAPEHDALVPYVAVGGGAALDLGTGLYTGIDVDVETHLLRIDDSVHEAHDEVSFGARFGLAIGKRL